MGYLFDKLTNFFKLYPSDGTGNLYQPLPEPQPPKQEETPPMAKVAVLREMPPIHAMVEPEKPKVPASKPPKKVQPKKPATKQAPKKKVNKSGK